MFLARKVVTGLVLLVGTATMLGLLDRFFWVFELADVFRVQYLVVLLAAGAISLALSRPRVAVLAAAFAAVNVAVLGVPFSAAANAAPRATGHSIRLVVANVEVGNTNFTAVESLVRHTSPDLLGVTELTPAMADHLRSAFPQYRGRVIRTRSDAYGIGVFSRLPLLATRIAHFPTDGGPPTVVVRLRISGTPVTVVVTHVHTPFAGSIHVRHLQALAAARPQLGKRLVVCGDFNTPPWSGPLEDFAGDTGLRDLYGHDAWAAYSWPTWFSGLRVPLDNCFVSSGVFVTAHRDGAGVGSDHRPLVVDLAARA